MAISGAETPLYNPNNPSFASVCLNSPNTEDDADAPPVCIFTLIRSNGWPTITVHIPPTPPLKNDFNAESAVLEKGRIE